MIGFSIEQIARVADGVLDQVVAVGDEAAPILTGAKSEPHFAGELVAVPDEASAVAAITQRLRPGDVVLVKASRAAGLQAVALALTAVPETPVQEAAP